MKKIVAKIRLFLIEIKIIWGGGLADHDTWKQKQKLEEVIKYD